MRLPLPTKVLLSYLGVVAVGAVPTFFYLRQELSHELVQEAAERQSDRARRMATVLAAAPPEGRGALMRELAALTPERLTYIGPAGEVIFDSHVDPALLRSHGERPEILAARRTQSKDVAGNLEALPAEPGMGVARRVSSSTGQDTLYVAVGIPTDAPLEARSTLRMARTVNTILEATHRTVAFLRNAQALAVSLAIGLSLLSALVLVRPLRRVRALAEKLASGDVGARAGAMGNDEIGDVARALEALGVAVRQRVAAAGAGEALLVQLVQVVEAPLVIFAVDGEVLAVNGAARALLGVEGPGAGQRVRELIDERSFQESLRRAEEEGQPEEVRLPNKDAERPGGAGALARVFVLKRPGAAPLGLLLGPAAARGGHLLPTPAQVRPRSLEDMLAEVSAKVSPALLEAGVELDVPAKLPAVSGVAVGGRVVRAIEMSLLGCTPAFGGRPGRLSLDIEVRQTRVGLALDAAPPAEVIALVRPLLEPLGGGVEVTSGEATLWLPRA